MDGFALRKIAVVAGIWLFGGIVSAAGPKFPAWREDATLHDVYFVDAQTGWAVGDRGTLWQTRDGGAHWSLHALPTNASLRSIAFADAQRGWIAGGWPNPYSGVTSGTLWRTLDGGKTWRQIETNHLPDLRQIGFFDLKHGWAVGEPSSLFPSGLLQTSDGGLTWQPVGELSHTRWNSAAMGHRSLGALVGVGGKLSFRRKQSLEPAEVGSIGLRNLHEVLLTNGPQGWAIGDGALVFRTQDAGHSWQLPPTELPPDAHELFDWQAMTAVGQHVWITGKPGTRVVHTQDGGRNWYWFNTEQNLPLHGLHFVDQQHGWAVGALGTILKTIDGGRTWQRQHSGGTRAALLGVFAQPEEIPWEMLAELSGNEGYLSVVHLLARHDLANSQAMQRQSEPRTQAALLSVGGSQFDPAWRFAWPQQTAGLSEDEILQQWNERIDGDVQAEIHRELVKRIRLWRPTVLVTSSAKTQTQHPLSRWLQELVRQAAEDADDPTRYPEHFAHAGLHPWKVDRLFGSLGAEASGDVTVKTTQLGLRLGEAYADAAISARGFLQAQSGDSPELWGFVQLEGGKSRGDFFSGLQLHPGSDARRQLNDSLLSGTAQLRKLAQRRRNVDQLIARLDETPKASLQLGSQIGSLVQGLKPEMGGTLIFQLAGQMHREGRWQQAAELHHLLIDQYPQHPAAPQAAVWLVQYYCSSEAAWRMQKRGSDAPRQDVVKAALTRNLNRDQAEQENSQAERWDKAATVAKWLQREHPAVYHQPSVRFPLTIADRRRGFPQQAESYILELFHARRGDAWGACAAAERWLGTRDHQNPKPVWECVPTETRPYLDGKLDDPCWQKAKPIVIHPPLKSGKFPETRCRLAYDDKFFYLAVSCQRAEKNASLAPEVARPRDADLSQRDRVELWLDLDRDYTTAFHLQMDDRGWVAEDCWGDSSWNPNWFVAATQSEEHWTIEAAIPWWELTGQPPQAPNAWTVGVVRTLPKLGAFSWSFSPNSPGHLAEMGLLVFR